MLNHLPTPSVYLPIALAILTLYLTRRLPRILHLRRLARHHGCLPAFHSPVPFFLHQYRRLLAQRDNTNIYFSNSYYDQFDKKTIQHSRTYITIEPENVKTVLSTSFASFGLESIRLAGFFPLLGKGVFTSDGADWKFSRELIRPQFKRGEIQEELLSAGMKRNVDRWLDLVEEKAGMSSDDVEEIDIQPLCFKLTLDNAMVFLFGRSPGALFGTDTSTFDADFAESQKWTLLRVIMGSWFREILTPRAAFDAMDRCKKFIEGYVDEELARRARSGGKKDDDERYIVLRAMADETQDRAVLRDQMLHILLAGRDTTAAFIGFSIYCLGHHPDVYSKLRRIVLEHFSDDSELTFEALKNVKYLQYVLNEVLRLFPSVPNNGRMALEDTILPLGGGEDERHPLLIKKGDHVGYSVWSMHRRKDIWGEDAEDFRPERWEGRKSGWEYLPFNGGPRLCLGQQYALSEGAYVLVRFVKRFEELEVRGNEWGPGEKKTKIQAALTMAPRVLGVRVKKA